MDELGARERSTERPSVSRTARYVIALTGAGLSVESGIPPFRGPGRALDEARRAADGRLPALPRRPAAGVGGAAEPDRPDARAVGGARGGAPEPGTSGAGRARGARRAPVHASRRTSTTCIAPPAAARLLEIHGNATLIRCIRCVARFPRETIDFADAAAALPALRRHPQERHGVVRRADPARRARSGASRRRSSPTA